MNSEAESINNFKFLIELSITQFSKFFNLKLLKNLLALAANSRSLNYEKEKRPACGLTDQPIGWNLCLTFVRASLRSPLPLNQTTARTESLGWTRPKTHHEAIRTGCWSRLHHFLENEEQT